MTVVKLVGCSLALGLCLVPRLAGAKLLDIYGQAGVGAGFGAGLSGEPKDDAFFDNAAGGAYAFRLGVEVLFVDALVDHTQYFDGGGVSHTWTQFMLGFDVDFSLGDDPPPGQKPPQLYAEIGAYLGYGMGTEGQVDPPLDNDQLTDKGLVGMASIGVDYRLNDIFSFGVVVPLSYGYTLKNGAANDEDNYYQQFGAAALAYARFSVGVGK